jgi:hypothetical protein
LSHSFDRKDSRDAGATSAPADSVDATSREKTGVPAARQPGELNEPQKRRLSVTCDYIDKLLQDVEQVLDSGSSKSPFSRYVMDVTPEQRSALEDYIRELRSALLRALAWQQMQPREARIPASRAVLINLNYIGIAIEELKPRYMRGAGSVPEDAVDGLNGVVRDLGVAAENMERYLLREFGMTAEHPAEGAAESGAP